VVPTGAMNSPRRLLFGDDGSPASDVAWLFVASHRWTGWNAEVATVQVPVGISPVDPVDREFHPWSPAHVRTEGNAIGFGEVCYLTATGDPRLLLSSREKDLLVIGPRGPGLFKTLHLGSTAEWLLLKPPSPLLIARHGHAVTSALICSDGSAHAQRAIDVFAELPWISTVDVTILVVDDFRVDVDVAAESAQSKLSELARSSSVYFESGNPTQAIMHHLVNNPADLVVMGTSGLTGIRHLGSTASAVTHAAESSMLIACDAAAIQDTP
jgi:nucleotide-binding universal stress UspA family protein